MKAKRTYLTLLILFFLAGCATIEPRPGNTQNVCSIFKQRPAWYNAAKKSERRWGVPVSVQMAMMRQESDFVADAKPPRRKLLWIIPWKRQSTAYGYSQALNGVWDTYQSATRHYFADRADFGDAIDFMGWYNRRSARQLHLPTDDAYSLYLAYVEGWRGYRHGSYKRKAWLMRAAKRVDHRAARFERQLAACEPQIQQRAKKKSTHFIFF